jgi:hypothetical protein
VLHSLIGVAGLIGLVTLAFGNSAAMWLARLIIVVPLLFVTGSLLLRWLIMHGIVGPI